jgi:hypothetical protein
MAASHSPLIRHLRLSGEEAQPDDDAGQDDDDEGATPGPTAGLPRHVTRLPSPPMRTTLAARDTALTTHAARQGQCRLACSLRKPSYRGPFVPLLYLRRLWGETANPLKP